MYVYMYVCTTITYQYSKSKDHLGKVANLARGQLNRENEYFLSPLKPENLVSRDGFGIPVPRQPVHLHTQAESVLTYGIPPDIRDGVWKFIYLSRPTPSVQSRVHRATQMRTDAVPC